MKLSQLFLSSKDKNKILLDQALKEDYIIIDVRTKQEFEQGHLKDSINIPLHLLSEKIEFLNSINKTIITCCRSGARSTTAVHSLQKKGIVAIDGGSWIRLQQNQLPPNK